ncbi:hypothetical protein BGZ68_007115 [Mortierella alpina]|nr:hypothetical protein BGZ68_007115 [Mortierella alpina]
MSNTFLKGKPQSMEDYELSGSRPLHPPLESVEDDEDSCAVSNASNPYQRYFDAFEFQDFDVCGFFRWQGFKSSEEGMATNEWLHVVLPWVEKLNRAHASRLRHVFKTTAAKRSRFWEELQENEAQEHLRKTVKTSVLDMQEDMVVLTTEEFKRTTQDELADEPVFRTLNQETAWREGDTDYLDLFNTYRQSVTDEVNHYFQFGPTIPSHLNEREAFVDCTWSFIRGAFTAAGIQTRMLEVAISGSKERKTQVKSRGERLEVARKADGVGMHDQHQIYIAESALIYGATQDKMDEDCWKSKRALRDSWVSQIKAISQDAHPRTGMSVFGSTSHNRQTQFFAMDYKGVFRVRTLTSMTMPVQADSFAAGMQQCILACLEFVLHVLDETERRNLAKKITLHKDREDFLEAAATIPTTSNTPKKGILKPQ